MMKRLLPIFMFLLIFSPKVAGNLDTLSMMAVVIFFLAVITSSLSNLNSLLLRKVRVYMTYFLIMVVYTFIVLNFNNYSDYFQPLRFGRMVINTMGVVGLFGLYIKYYKGNAGNAFIFHLWTCIVAHGFLMLAMFVFPSINAFVIDNLIQAEEGSRGYEARIEGYRIGGLTGSWDAISGIQALAIIMLPFIWNKEFTVLRKTFILLTIPVSFFSVAIAGATGFVVLSIIGLVLFLRVGGLTRKIKYLSFFGLIVLGLWLVAYSLIENNNQLLTNSAIGRTVFMFVDDGNVTNDTGLTAKSTLEKISNEMYFLPDDFSTFFWGKGGSGRSARDYIIKADPGPTLNLHNIGFIATVFIYLLVISEVIRGLRLSGNSFNYFLLVSLILTVILVIDFKVQYLLARQSLSIMMIALMVFWHEEYYKKNKTRCSTGSHGVILK